jgi:Uma2 family endonuclease
MLASQLETLIDERALQSQDPEDRYLTTGVSWQQYEALLVQLGDRPGFRVTYLDGVLEIVSPSLRHEDTKSRIGDLLLIYFLETDTEYYPKGSTTFRQQERRGGTEADESYCIGTDKALPDLAIEVVVTSGGLNRLEIYSRLQVPEVWFWHHEGFSLYHLREETPATFIQTYGYEEITRSELLPYLDVNLLTAYVRHPNPLTAAKEFRQRLREELDQHL